MGIFIDHKKCDAYKCNKCLKSCDKRVLGRFPINIKKNQLSKEFKIEIVFPEYCIDGCMRCEKVCPKGAIKVDPAKRTNDMSGDLQKKVFFKHKFKFIKFIIYNYIKKVGFGGRKK